uniref:Uncharacterized protein n=1 Tax=Syphacia muris TaxID=451379 RepID=A0A0N5AIA3_9BILA
MNSDIDESIAMLMGYAEDLNILPNELPPNSCCNEISSEAKNESLPMVPAGCQSSCNTYAIATNTAAGSTPDKSDFHIANGCCGTSSMMSDSIYDNVQDPRRLPAFSALDSTNNSGTSVSSAFDCLILQESKVEKSRKGANSDEFEISANLPSRDISVCSGLLADSESSPSSPPPNLLLNNDKQKNNEKKLSQNLNTNATRRLKITPTELECCMQRTSNSNASPPPPPPAQSAPKKLQNLARISTSLDSTTSNTKVMQRAGSCDELNTQRDQQMCDVVMWVLTFLICI